MSLDIFLALAAFSLVSSITPGPNNLMLMTSGANFGFRRSVPHMLGIGVGFVVMVVLVGLGLIGLFDAYPVSYRVLKIVSLLYLGWLAWRIANAGTPASAKAPGRPMRFIEAALFQWVNPKAWAMALTAITAYTPTQSTTMILLVAAVFGLINLPSVSLWTLLGQEMRRFLTNPARLRAFNWLMAALLVASTVPVIFA